MEKSEKDIYFLAVKIFLRDKNKLLILKDTFGEWDIPGGRLTKDDFSTPFEDIAKLKIAEEIGSSVKYSLGEPKNFFRAERLEVGLNNLPVRIFAISYEAKYLGGEIELGSYMDKYRWVDVSTFKPETLFTGGWLTGIQEYLKTTKNNRNGN